MGIRQANRVSQVKEYYFSSKLREIRESGRDIINLAIGSPDLPPHQDVVKELNLESQKEEVHSYQSYQGISELRQRWSQWYRENYRVDLDPDKNILPLIGSKEGIMHITMAFVDPGDEVLIPNPGYPAYSSVTQLAGGIPVPYTLTSKNNWYPDLTGLSGMDLTKVKVMWVNYPHMPTGTKADPGVLKDLVQFGKDHEILIVNDNPYSFILNDNPASILEFDPELEVTLELNSLSKTFNMAGWRVGMVASNQEFLKSILVFKSNMDSGMFYPIQKAAIKALRLDRSWYDNLTAIYSKRKKRALEILNLLGCKYENDQAGMFVWSKVPEGWEDGRKLSEYVLEQADVFIAPGFIFGSEGEKYIRISLCSKEEAYVTAKERIKERLLVKN